MTRIRLQVDIEVVDGHMWLAADRPGRAQTLVDVEQLFDAVPGIERVDAQFVERVRHRMANGGGLAQHSEVSQVSAKTKRQARRRVEHDDLEARGKTMLHQALPDHAPAQVRATQLIVADVALEMEPEPGQTREQMLAELLAAFGLYRKTGLEVTP